MRSSLARRGLCALQQQWSSHVSATQERLVAIAAPALEAGIRAVSTASSSSAPTPRQQSNCTAGTSANSWEQLLREGIEVNPCRSPHHPAAVQGIVEPAGKELSVQAAYNPDSQCFGCGQAHPEGLKLQSRRMSGDGLGRLEASLRFDPKYCAFPGIVNGGVLSTVMDCHGNWAAAIALMDKGCLPRPPLTLTSTMQVNFKAPTPPDTDLLMRSRVLSIRENVSGNPMRATVEVEVVVALPGTEVEREKVLAVATGTFKRMGALRSL
ncbi:hypothetical protein Agub_g12258 [Astrephomene gubernaculifera]|uniref:Thioesterase domain-containing protein n=1 Tax=Astrephomene gubernaculifera TaxID=47775 RepID=A0AAD3DXZ0_9CHLO|nr:hypothetical protein Agub_g12258 [Astrephomene gubernaculifera]